MRSFCEYVTDHEVNKLWYFAKKYDRPNHFMSFTEATWNSKNSGKVPNGITAFPISKTLHRWKDTPNGKQFELVQDGRVKLYILQASQTSFDYSEDEFNIDVRNLKEFYDFRPNSKLIKNYRNAMQGKSPQIRESLQHEISKEQNKFMHMVNEATDMLQNPDEKLWEVTKWLAANGKNPNENFSGNASQRWTNILRKIGYSAFVMEDIALFLDPNEFEVIDEI
jgi:hypothetical protein